jgi:predicted HicB family RNase H-like nuclease
MDAERKHKQCFLLRLPVSVHDRAAEIAEADGTSLNHFISLAVVEKIDRMERSSELSIYQMPQFGT